MSTNQQRVAMITGGNSGIGFAAVKKLDKFTEWQGR